MARNPSKRYAYKTAVFQIHNPSKKKQAMLRDCLLRNHLAYSFALKKLLPKVEKYKSIENKKKREAAIKKDANTFVKPRPLSIGAKAGVLSDIAGQLSSFIELQGEQEAPSPPTAAKLKSEHIVLKEALEKLAGVLTSEEAYGLARDMLAKAYKARQCRPVLFLKNRVQDGYLLLYSEQKQAYYVYMNLHSAKNSRFAEKISVNGLTNVRDNRPIEFESSTGALFPVKFGRDYQLEKFIEKAKPQSAKLLEKDGTFEVHITFEYEASKIIPETFMGIDRGGYNLASLAILDKNYGLLEKINIDGKELRHIQRLHERRQKDWQKRGKNYTSRSRRAMADEAVHAAANKIVSEAKKHKSQIIMENLQTISNRGRKRKKSNFNRLLNRTQYQKLQKVLEYKLAVEGLPPPKTVHPAYTSQTCAVCGYQAAQNRLKIQKKDAYKMDTFLCGSCGFKADADLNAAYIIALKRLWRDGLPEKYRKKELADIRQNHAEYAFDAFIKKQKEKRN